MTFDFRVLILTAVMKPQKENKIKRSIAKQTDLIIRPFYLPMRKFSNYITADSRETESGVHSRAPTNTFVALLERKMKAADVRAAGRNIVGGRASDQEEQDADESKVQRDSEDVFSEEGTTLHIQGAETESIQVDEFGAIPAFVAEETTEANVVGVIDEELEREDKKEFINFICKSIACIVLLVVIVGVPVTLHLTDNGGGNVVVVPPHSTEVPSSMPSDSPTAMPTTEKFTSVVEKLLPLSGEQLIQDGSPQQRAARWIADDDPMQLDINDPSFEERYAMGVMFYSLNGDNWGFTNWLTGASECNWDYVGGGSTDCLSGCTDGKICSLVFRK